jgi:hypothetical protein
MAANSNFGVVEERLELREAVAVRLMGMPHNTCLAAPAAFTHHK